MFDKPKGDGLAQYNAWKREAARAQLRKAADDYEKKIPANIRSALARVAQVDNSRLDELALGERRRLNIEARKLIAKLVEASQILARADVTAGIGSKE